MKVRLILDITGFWATITESHMKYLEGVGITFYDIFHEALTLVGMTASQFTEEMATNCINYARLEQHYAMTIGNNRPMLSNQPIFNYSDAIEKYVKAVVTMYKCIYLGAATYMHFNVRPQQCPLTITTLDVGRLENQTYIAEVGYEYNGS